KKRFDSVGVEDSEENRRAYREMLLTTPGLNQHISGAILFDETIRQSTRDGVPFTKLMMENGIIPGIKVDKGLVELAGFPGEKITEGLDGLRNRLAEYARLGAKFAKWRALITISGDAPSGTCIEANSHALARYSALCQEAGLVPRVEPEILLDGEHDIDECYDVTEATLRSLFGSLYEHNVMLEGTILKVSMVLPGNLCSDQASVEDVAEATVRCLKAAVPASLPGIVFLSGGQSDEDSTAHLNAMNQIGPHPWPLSFSYGRAMQQAALKLWGADMKGNFDEAQKTVAMRARENGLAALGQWKKGS
ncbi:MAG: class I fructose-bisphosphate aldolase, partial [Dokdonella sp.]